MGQHSVQSFLDQPKNFNEQCLSFYKVIRAANVQTHSCVRYKLTCMQIFFPRNSGINSWLILFSCELIDVILNNFHEAANRLHLNAVFPHHIQCTSLVFCFGKLLSISASGNFRQKSIAHRSIRTPWNCWRNSWTGIDDAKCHATCLFYCVEAQSVCEMTSLPPARGSLYPRWTSLHLYYYNTTHSVSSSRGRITWVRRKIIVIYFVL